MTALLAYWELGFRHIVDVGALDHLLFLVALAIPYRATDWRKLVIVASAFTVGHSITLALAVSGAARLTGSDPRTHRWMHRRLVAIRSRPCCRTAG